MRVVKAMRCMCGRRLPGLAGRYEWPFGMRGSYGMYTLPLAILLLDGTLDGLDLKFGLAFGR